MLKITTRLVNLHFRREIQPQLAQRNVGTNIESSQVWDTSCLAELINDLTNRQFLCYEVSLIGDDSVFANLTLGRWAQHVRCLSSQKPPFLPEQSAPSHRSTEGDAHE